MSASVISLADRRPLVKLVAESDAAALRDAFALTPRGRFETAISRLTSLGHVQAGRLILYCYRRFSALDRIPHPDDFGLCMKLLAEVDPSDALASQHVRHAMTALVAIARPFPETTQPECA